MGEKILYIFPHPDDESFGPAAVIHSQILNGHEVYLLTLTKGGATKQRFKLGLTVGEMGEIRYREMLAVEQSLGLDGMVVLDYPDGGLKELDPRLLEREVRKHIEEMKPAVIVTYPVHGVSGFHDHIVMHAVVKRVFLEMKDDGADYLRRLAFITLPDNGDPVWRDDGTMRLKLTDNEMMDCIIPLDAEDIQALKNALTCYATYQETIEKSGVLEKIGDRIYFEIYGEDFSPVLHDLTEKLP